jgi:hypothetical protein
MKEFWKQFFLRGLTAAAGGPLVLALIYAILGQTGVVTSLSPQEVCLGILSSTLLAFTVAGLTAVYQLEQLPLSIAIAIHCTGLYLSYILIYLLNGWLQRQLIPVLVFTAFFVAGYSLIWLIIYLISRAQIKQLNRKLYKSRS